MANDLAAMKARIALELARSDLTTQIASAITDAISVCQKYRFRFSETVPNAAPNFVAVLNTSTYVFPAPGFVSIDYVVMVAGAVFTHLSREQPELVLLKAMQIGTPEMFAVEGERIILAPAPNIGVSFHLHGHLLVAAPASDGEANNRWMTDGERMIRFLAKREIYRNVLRNKATADEMDAAFITERDELLSEAGKLLLFQGQQVRQKRVPPERAITPAPSATISEST